MAEKKLRELLNDALGQQGKLKERAYKTTESIEKDDIQTHIDSFQQQTSYSLGCTLAGHPNYTIVSAYKVDDWRKDFERGIVPAGFICRHMSSNIAEVYTHHKISENPESGDKIFFGYELFAVYEKEAKKWELRIDGKCPLAPPITSEQIPVINGVETQNSKWLDKDIIERNSRNENEERNIVNFWRI